MARVRDDFTIQYFAHTKRRAGKRGAEVLQQISDLILETVDDPAGVNLDVFRECLGMLPDLDVFLRATKLERTGKNIRTYAQLSKVDE